MVSTLSGSDLVLVSLAVVCLGATAALAVSTWQLRVLVRDLREEIVDLRSSALPAADRLTEAAQAAAAQVDRLDDLISVASSVTGTVEGATAATVRVLSNPVIRTAAVARGTKRAARRLRAAD